VSAAASLIAEAAARGVKLQAVAGGLRYVAPRGALSPELRDRIVACKPAVLRYLADVALGQASTRLANGWPGRELAARLCPSVLADFDAAETATEHAIVTGGDWLAPLVRWEAAGDAVKRAVAAARRGPSR